MTVLVVILLLTVPSLYIFIMRLFYFVLDRQEDFLFMARGLLFDEALEKNLRLQGCLPTAYRSKDGRQRWRTVPYQGQTHHYYVNWIRGELSLLVINEVLRHKLPVGGRILLVSNGLPGKGVEERVQSLQGRLTVLIIPTMDDIPGVVNACFKSDVPTSYLI